MGHFHTNHYFPAYLDSEQSRLRREYTNKGQIYPAEYDGGFVAAFYSGKDIIYKALSQAIRERHRTHTKGRHQCQYSLVGIEKAKESNSKMQSDEEIEIELCKLCNVPSIELL